MDEFLKLVDALRTRGATEIKMGEFSARFDAPVLTQLVPEAKESMPQQTLNVDEIEALLYKETMNL
jgi:hypothetical protein